MWIRILISRIQSFAKLWYDILFMNVDINYLTERWPHTERCNWLTWQYMRVWVPGLVSGNKTIWLPGWLWGKKTKWAMFCCRLGGLSDGSHLEGHDWCHNFKEDKYFQQKEEHEQEIFVADYLQWRFLQSLPLIQGRVVCQKPSHRKCIRPPTCQSGWNTPWTQAERQVDDTKGSPPDNVGFQEIRNDWSVPSENWDTHLVAVGLRWHWLCSCKTEVGKLFR